jgi:hypothetical protein
MNTVRTSTPLRPSRRRRWVVAAVVIALVLAVYGAGLGWFAQRLRSDLDSTIQPVPTSQDTRHRSD